MPLAPDHVTMAVLTGRTDAALAADLCTASWRAEPRLPVPTINKVAELARRDSAHRRFEALPFGTFSGVAILLVAGDLAGTLLYRCAASATLRAERIVVNPPFALSANIVCHAALAAHDADEGSPEHRRSMTMKLAAAINVRERGQREVVRNLADLGGARMTHTKRRAAMMGQPYCSRLRAGPGS
jgi:hypothetical protein